MGKNIDPIIITMQNSVYKLGQQVIYRKIDDDLIIINLRTDKIFSVNHTGAILFELLASQIELDQVKEMLINKFDVTPDELERELDSILESFTKEGILYAI